MNGLQFINFTLEAIGVVTVGYLVGKWYFKDKRYKRKKREGGSLK